MLIERDHLANVTSLEHERWKRAHETVDPSPQSQMIESEDALLVQRPDGPPDAVVAVHHLDVGLSWACR